MSDGNRVTLWDEVIINFKHLASSASANTAKEKWSVFVGMIYSESLYGSVGGTVMLHLTRCQLPEIDWKQVVVCY